MDTPAKVTAFRITNASLALLHLYAAAVQYNDPDPLLWVPAYLLASTAGFLALMGRLNWIFPCVLGAGCLVGALILSFRVLGQQPLMGSEEGREMSGLFLVTIWMTGLTLWTLKQQAPSTEVTSSASEETGPGN